MPNVIIEKIHDNPGFVELVAKAWYVLAIEGSPPDVYENLQKFSPYFTYQVHEVLSIDELPEVTQ